MNTYTYIGIMSVGFTYLYCQRRHCMVYVNNFGLSDPDSFLATFHSNKFMNSLFLEKVGIKHYTPCSTKTTLCDLNRQTINLYLRILIGLVARN